MKKKKLYIIVITLILVILLAPIRMNLKDGGSVRYKSLVYEITKIHQHTPDADGVKPYIDGFEVKILGMTVLRVTNELGKNDTYKIKITVPAGSTEEIIYSVEEISPTGNKITISSGEGLGDTEVVLKPIEVKEEKTYEPTYLTPGMPVEMDAEKGAWFKIGVSMQNPTDTDRIVYVEVEGVEVRIE